VARKTANVVLGTAFRIPSGVVVDTHGIRVSERLGLLGVKPRPVDRAPEQIEIRLMALFPKDEWIDIGHRLTLHGRYTCTAYDRKCGQCSLMALCPSVREDA
jgi:endonuclease-3